MAAEPTAAVLYSEAACLAVQILDSVGAPEKDVALVREKIVQAEKAAAEQLCLYAVTADQGFFDVIAAEDEEDLRVLYPWALQYRYVGDALPGVARGSARA